MAFWKWSGEERGLMMLGLGAAASASAFAAFMLTSETRAPRIAAIEHFGIFAKPARIAAQRPKTDHGVDMTVTGGVAPPPLRATIKDGPRLEGYKLIGVVGEEAILLGDAGFRKVQRGAELPDKGRIAAIEQRGEYWIVVMQDGAIIGGPPPTAAP